jgi:hypothetical protein
VTPTEAFAGRASPGARPGRAAALPLEVERPPCAGAAARCWAACCRDGAGAIPCTSFCPVGGQDSGEDDKPKRAPVTGRSYLDSVRGSGILAGLEPFKERRPSFSVLEALAARPAPKTAPAIAPIMPPTPAPNNIPTSAARASINGAT